MNNNFLDEGVVWLDGDQVSIEDYFLSMPLINVSFDKLGHPSNMFLGLKQRV